MHVALRKPVPSLVIKIKAGHAARMREEKHERSARHFSDLTVEQSGTYICVSADSTVRG